MPGPASVWLTSDPAAPAIPVSVTMTSPHEPSLLFSHTFAPGAAVRGDFATSEGRYRLAALGENCVLDLTLGPSDVADVVLAIEGSSCGLEVLRVRSMDDPTTWTHQPAVLITNRGVGSKTPAIEPRPSSLP